MNNNYLNYINYNTHRERTKILLDERTNSNVNDSMSKYINNIYEEKITKLKEEIKGLRNDKEKIRTNLVLLISLIKKYLNKLLLLFGKINEGNNYENKEILNTVNNLNDFIEKIETNNFTLEDKIIIDKFFVQNSLNESQEIEKNINEIISKYEKKINIINNHNKEMFSKITNLKNENGILKQQLNEEKNIKENMLNKLNMMKEINNNLEKKNKILDSKCRSYFNQSNRSKYEQKNFEEEINYQNDEIFKKINERNINNINKIIDLKKNLKKVINVTKYNINSDENEKSFNNMNSNEKSNKKNCNIENGSHYFIEKSFSSVTNKTNNAKVKKEIDLLDKEIEQIQTKLETMIKSE